ncbi:MAG: hypothetical protein V6Z86_09170 [Hyphomicrobiales bacterium]
MARQFADYIPPGLETGGAGGLQYTQGKAASAWFKDRIEEKLKAAPIDAGAGFSCRSRTSALANDHRLLASVSPPTADKKERGCRDANARHSISI